MEKEAIKQIQESANIPAIIDQLKALDTKAPCIVTPDNFNVKNLESYMEHRTNYRLAMNTNSLADFIAYSQKYQQEGATCFINAEQMRANTVFDLGTEIAPGHQQHSSTLSLEKTAQYKAILNTNGDRLSQKNASEFIEDWGDFITVYSSDGEVIQNPIAAKRLRDLTIETAREINSKVEDFSESMSAMERIEAKGKELLPNKIQFICKPYSGLAEYNFTIRVSILTGGDKPQLGFRIIQLEAVQEKIVNEFKEALTNAFEENKIETFIGSI
ncbi:DUF2303 family protein [Psychromonas sp. 14N.309.X.WAT.B.A12]|uniref:DUF2303 family protein n=1 Tax=Psychromonas sp. 14N.309.X.WAT.B.A12 TaxID=2998322 RepID=UPI0025B262A4|nr:DUF2303 family protein [Psychromonas sp. 14N.309.X.WAT.B.A12]MDN2661814.1 DUF2303 family protein [Psychromonas sp. 14N.309.X.WAT.B.A12]